MSMTKLLSILLLLAGLAVTPRAEEPSPIGGDAGLKPVLLEMFGRKHYYQLPAGKAKGVVAVLPGCARSAYGFWPWSPADSKFFGFSEDVSHTQQILKQGYAILVLTPNDTRTLCWSAKGDDPAHIAALITGFQKANGLAGKPLYLLGASSGGGLAVRFASSKASAKLPISGIISEVSTRAVPTEKSPPIVWIVMKRDINSLQDIKPHMAAMKQWGIPCASAIQPPRRITPTFFSEQLAAITPAQSAQMTDVLRKIGLIDADGNLLADPKDAMKGGAFKWDSQLRQQLPWLAETPATSLTFRTSGIWQAMLAAWAKHEHTAMFTTAALEWFEGGMNSDFATLAKQHQVTKPSTQ